MSANTYSHLYAPVLFSELWSAAIVAAQGHNITHNSAHA